MNCRKGPKWASIGLAQEALVGVKHSSTWCFFAQAQILAPLWAERLSMITWIGSPSGRAARIDLSAAREFTAPLRRRLTPHRVSSPTE